jgi:hypothetical protein
MRALLRSYVRLRHRRAGPSPPIGQPHPGGWGRLRRSRNPLEAVERPLARNIYSGAIAEINKDFDQMLRMLIRARARRIGRIKTLLVVIRRRNPRLATRRPERQMDNMRRDTRMPHKGRMQLERQVRGRYNGMDGQHVSTRPGTRRLARGGSTVDGHV